MFSKLRKSVSDKVSGRLIFFKRCVGLELRDDKYRNLKIYNYNNLNFNVNFMCVLVLAHGSARMYVGYLGKE